MERLKNWLRDNLRRICAVGVALVCVTNIMRIPCEAKNVRVIYSSGSGNDLRVALTFDDGPHPYRTARILDILKSESAKATFFVVGENVQYYPDMFDRIVAEGHEIGNHTNHHTFLAGLDKDEVSRAIDGCDDEIYHHDEYSTRLLRPPGGNYDTTVLQFCALRDYTVVLWSIDTRDWAGTSAAEIEKNVLENVKDGDIILMHDYVSRRAHTEEALRNILPKLKERGYRFVTVSELIDDRG